MTVPRLSTAQRWAVLRRSTKVGIAAALATSIAQLLHLPSPWFATLAAIVAMHSTLDATLRGARDSLLGAVLGAGLGLGLAWLAKDQAWAVGVAVIVPLVAFGLLRLEVVGQQAALIASVIVLVPVNDDFSDAQFAGIRLAQAVIGIAVAVLVQATILPPRAQRKVRVRLAVVYGAMADVIETSLADVARGIRSDDMVKERRAVVRRHLVEVDSMWDEAMAERPASHVLDSHWRSTTRRIWDECTVMATDLGRSADSPLVTAVLPEMRALADEISTDLRAVASAFTAGTFDPTGPAPDVAGLEPRRRALLDRVRTVQPAVSEPYAETLAALAAVNALNVIASRLTDVVDRAEVVPAVINARG